jgi:DNA-binding MarR family transcriptional regulator
MKYENIESFNPMSCISNRTRRLSRVVANVFRKYLKPFDITDSQLTLLFILSKMPDLNQKQLSEMATLEKSSLNRNLKRLVERELVSKADFPKINITEKGLQLVNDIIPEWRKAMDEIEEIIGQNGVTALDLLMGKVFQQED